MKSARGSSTRWCRILDPSRAGPVAAYARASMIHGCRDTRRPGESGCCQTTQDEQLDAEEEDRYEEQHQDRHQRDQEQGLGGIKNARQGRGPMPRSGFTPPRPRHPRVPTAPEPAPVLRRVADARGGDPSFPTARTRTGTRWWGRMRARSSGVWSVVFVVVPFVVPSGIRSGSDSGEADGRAFGRPAQRPCGRSHRMVGRCRPRCPHSGLPRSRGVVLRLVNAAAARRR